MLVNIDTDKLKLGFLNTLSQEGVDEDDLPAGATQESFTKHCTEEYLELVNDDDIVKTEKHFNTKFDYSTKHCDLLIRVVLHRRYFNYKPN